MTTLQPGKAPTEVHDPYYNKAIAAGVTALCTIAAQWVATGELEFDQEGITAIGGAVATGLVWFVSNWKKKGA